MITVNVRSCWLIAGVRASGAAGVAHATAALSEPGVCGGEVERTGLDDPFGTVPVDDTGAAR